MASLNEVIKRHMIDNNLENKDYLYENILITGIGGDIGSGIAKILRKSNIACKLIGSDIHNQHAGKYLVDEIIIIERADSENYLNFLKKVIDEYSIDLVIPMSVAEIELFDKKNLMKELDYIPIILANKKAMEIGHDKYNTYKFLKSVNLPYPWTIPVNEGPPQNIPCIIKSRTGSGSRSVNIVYEDFVNYYSKTRPNDLWQELLLPEDEEYTCGLYGLKNGELRTIVFKRRLSGGISVYGEIVINKGIEDTLSTLAKHLKLRGSINVQLRITKRGPVIFEINPRFSSTVVFRHLLGFKDLIWSIYEQKGIPLEEYIPPKEGTIFIRGSMEYIL